MDEGWESQKKYAKYERTDNPSLIRNLVLSEDWQRNVLVHLCLKYDKPNCARAIQGLDLYDAFHHEIDFKCKEQLLDMGVRLEWVRQAVPFDLYLFDYSRRRARGLRA